MKEEKEKKKTVSLTRRLSSRTRGRRAGPLQLPHLVAEGGGEPVPGLVDDERRERALAVVPGDDPGELLPLDGAAGGLVRLEQHVPHHLRHQLVLLLRRGRDVGSGKTPSMSRACRCRGERVST
jgi:hypothetical protein